MRSEDVTKAQEEHQYISEGRWANARIFRTHVPSGFEAVPVPVEGNIFPVHFFLRATLPTPFSAPTVHFGVSERADFRLEIWGDGEERIDAFEYSGVEPGVYTFAFAKAIWRGEQTRVILRHGGKLAGEMSMAERYRAVR